MHNIYIVYIVFIFIIILIIALYFDINYPLQFIGGDNASHVYGLGSDTLAIYGLGGDKGRDRNKGQVIYKDLAKFPRSKAEAAAIAAIEKLTKGAKFPTAYPKWLKYHGKRMELDGYNEDLAIAIEFGGPQHVKWNSAKETYAEYKQRLIKDKEKIRLCAVNKVKLIVMDIGIPQHLYETYIESRLYDIGYIKERPYNYMIEKNIEPYVNINYEQSQPVN